MSQSLTGPFNIELPKERIAQKPVSPRDTSRLLVCSGLTDRLGEFSRSLTSSFDYEHRVFCDLVQLLTPKHWLVVNDTRVLPVRVLGHRIQDDGTVGGAVEAVVLRKLNDRGSEWATILRLSARIKPGMKLLFDPGLILEILSTHEERVAADGEVRVRVSGISADRIGLEAWLERYGHVPLPPYIDRADIDEDRRVYQTVYAREAGSAAAPTAGFHFTEEMLSQLKARGVGVSRVTLNVGLGTFRPIKSDHWQDHKMHEENFTISPEFAHEFSAARAAGKRLVAVGTTVVRALESWVRLSPELAPGRYSTDIFIKPGFEFHAVDELITNFHLPDSTLIVLVAAAMGEASVREAYELAIREKYRFFSYGDAMYIRSSARKKMKGNV